LQSEINNPETNNTPEPNENPGPELSPGPPENPQPIPSRWGTWPTIGLGLAILVIYIMAQNIVALVFAIITTLDAYMSNPQLNILNYVKSLSTNGLLISIATFVSVTIGLGFIFLFIKIRRGFSFREYLELKSIGKKTVLVLLAVIVGILVISIGVDRFLPQQDNNFAIDTYKTAGWLPLLWIAVVIFAPLFEESFFRGFLFVGLKQSVLGPTGTIILTALIFAALHALQYNLYGIATVFVLGLIFGIVRLKSGSLWSTILLHSVWNLLQLVAVAFYLNQ